jgi:hypothetical protein
MHMTQLKTSILLHTQLHKPHQYSAVLHLLSVITNLVDFVHDTNPCAGYIEEIRQKIRVWEKICLCSPRAELTGLLIC